MRSSGPQLRTMAAVPSCPSFTIVIEVALTTVSMLSEGCSSKKLSRPGFPTSAASMMLPPNWPTLWRSRRFARWMAKRATLFSIMKSPTWLWASGPVIRSDSSNSVVAGSSLAASTKVRALVGGTYLKLRLLVTVDWAPSRFALTRRTLSSFSGKPAFIVAV